MRKLFFIFFTALFLFFGSFILTFSVPKMAITESFPDVFVDYSNLLSSVSLAVQKNEPFYLKTTSDNRNDLMSEGRDFLEVNFSRMAVRLYRGGKLAEEWPISAKGDPWIWGGSPLGLYKVLSKHDTAFSVIGSVYMPYSLHYYGKYYIHGVPYYPGGQKRTDNTTGGCVQLGDRDAKDIYNFAELNLPVLVVGKENDHYQFFSENLSDFPEVSAKSYLVADLDSGFVFAEKDSQEKYPISSLVKLMTATVIAENADLRKSIQIGPEMLEAYGATNGLEVGRELGVVELFYPLLVESSNDAASILSSLLGRVRIIEMMNAKAEAMLMQNTKFADSDGFSQENVSTARDLFKLAKYTTEARPVLWEITKGKEVRSFREFNFNIGELENRNVFFDVPDFVGGKTGYSTLSRYSAIFVFKILTTDRMSRDIAVILLGSNDNKKDTQEIYKWLLENYSLSPAAPAVDN